MRGQIALEQRRGSDAARLLVSAAKRLEPLDADLARETHLEALGAASGPADLDSPGGLLEAAEAARAAPPGPDPPRAVDVLLDAFAMRLTDGYAAGRADADPGTRAASRRRSPTTKPAARSGSPGPEPAPSSPSSCGTPSPCTCWPPPGAVRPRDGRARALAARAQLPAGSHLFAGELTTAALLVDEDRLIAEATGNPPLRYAPDDARGLARPRGPGVGADRGGLQEATAGAGLDRSTSRLRERGALQRPRSHTTPRATPPGGSSSAITFGATRVVPELAEAASRTGDAALLRPRSSGCRERTRVTRHRVGAGDRGPRPRPAQRGRRRRGLYREAIDAARPHPPPRRARPRPSALRRMAAPRAPPRRRARAAAHRHEMFARWASRRSPSAPGASCSPPARPSANAPSRPATS